MSNWISKRRTRLARLVLFLFVMSGLYCLPSAVVVAGWTRDITRGGTMATYPGVSVVIFLISSIDDRLSASGGYRYLERVGPVELHGKFDPYGEFSPLVEYQVAVGPNQWRTVAKSDKSAGPIAIKIDSANSHVMLNIDMEPFRHMIGKHRWGRIVLENGEAATLSLDDLLPTSDGPPGLDYKSAITDEDPGRFGSSLRLIAVTCLAGHLTGEFVFVGTEQARVAEFVGSRDSKGDFLPAVTLQAGDSDQHWRVLEEQTNVKNDATLQVSTENPLITIRVNLDGYRPAIGQAKYAKVLFSDGEYSVFELRALKTPCMSPPPPPKE